MRNIIFISLFWLVSSSITKVEAKNYTFVLVHGAWHGSWAYYQVEALLQYSGHRVICINLPGHGIDNINPGEVTLEDYQNAVTDVLDTITEPVILVGHSMGGIAISMAAEARPEKIHKLVYIAAFMPQNGESMLDLALQDTASLIGPNLIFDHSNNTVDISRDNLSEIFYNTTNAANLLLSKRLLTTNPLQPLIEELSLTPENYGSVEKFYISTLRDNAITPYFQYTMYRNLPFRNIYYMCTDHSPFLSAPYYLRQILLNIVRNNKDLKSTNENNTSLIPIAQNDIKVYINSMDQLCIENPEPIHKCNIKIYSLSGRLLDINDSSPESENFKYPLKSIHENFIIAVLKINGETFTKKLFVYN